MFRFALAGLIAGMFFIATVHSVIADQHAANAAAADTATEEKKPILFRDTFASGDMSATNEDGFKWGKNNRTSVVTMDDRGPRVMWNNGPSSNRPADDRNWKAYQGKYALRFRYPAGQAMAEQRFSLGKAYPEIWFRFWIRVPVNFQHGPNNPSNEKFFSLWMDGYSQAGEGATLIAGHWRQRDGNSRMAVGGTRSSESGYDFIVSDRDRGRWMQVVIYAKMSSSPDVQDGEARMWRRWENENEFTMIGETVNRDFQPPQDKSKPQGWAAGYLMGWSNALYEQDTEWLLDEFTISEHSLRGIGSGSGSALHNKHCKQ